MAVKKKPASKTKKKKKPGPKPGTKAFGERSKKRLKASGDKINKARKEEAKGLGSLLGLTGRKQNKKSGDPWVQTVKSNLIGGLSDKRLNDTKTEAHYKKLKAKARKKKKK